jgi:hypothetical protein
MVNAKEVSFIFYSSIQERLCLEVQYVQFMRNPWDFFYRFKNINSQYPNINNTSDIEATLQFQTLI